jgi:hypothetical protein
MLVPVFALPLATQLVIAVADGGVPKLDVTPSCRAAAAAATDKGRLQTCIDSEHKARDQLAKDWSTYAADDRNKCVNAAKGFSPTYTELITCLEMERDVRQARAQGPKEDAVAPKNTKKLRKKGD